MQYILNAIPGALIPKDGVVLEIRPVGAEAVPMEAASAIGHVDTAAVVGSILGRRVEAARVNVPVLADGDTHWLALYQGPRLPEGATSLPEGAGLALYRMTART